MANTQSTGGYQDTEWTLILWDIENVAVPEQLRNARGIQALTAELKQQFATSRGKELHCIKLACHWSHPRSSYSDLLGSLTTLGDVEALSYQWQGHADKTHSADRMLKRAADRFMRLVERRGPGAPRHLVVFITSDADFGYIQTDDGHRQGYRGNGYGQGKHWGTKGNVGKGHQANGYVVPLAHMQGANGRAPNKGQPAPLTGHIRQGMEQQPSNSSAAAVDDIRDPSSSMQQWHTDSDVEAVGSSDHTSSPASSDPDTPPQKLQTASSDVDANGNIEVQQEDSLGGQDADGSHEAVKPEGEVAWGFDSALDGEYELFTPDQCVPLEEQWNMLQCLDPENQAISEHRYFDLVVDYQLCNIDLVEMLLSSEYGGDAASRSVWRQG
ncbi:hypothetical protein WJX82_001912 [Trebouxia sp. C0006]